MKNNKDILMTIVRNSGSYLEGEQEIITINEVQLHKIVKELNSLMEI